MRLRFALAVLLAGTITACQEKLTEPGDCPALCPGGAPTVIDTVLEALPGLDSSFAGYVDAAAGPAGALLVSSGLQAGEYRGLVRFLPRSDSVVISDTARAYVIDSVALGFTVAARDTLQPGIRLVVYRLPRSTDTSTTFHAVEPLLADSTLIDTLPLADTLKTGAVRLVLSGDKLARVALSPADSGILAIGLRVTAPAPTGVRIASAAAGSSPSFTTYATADVADTAQRAQQLVRVAAFNSFVSQGAPQPTPDLLAVGGEPSSRALIRFALPARIRDSTSIVRATLELVPAQPIFGLRSDPAFLQARAVLSDLGAKSPVSGDPFVASVALPDGFADTVRLEVIRPLQVWLSSSTQPTALFLALAPEAASFSHPLFGSTRSPLGGPRLRISYAPEFPVESP